MRKRLPQAFASGKLSFIESSCQAFLQSQMGGWLEDFDQQTASPTENRVRPLF